MVTFLFLFTLLPKQSNRQGRARAVDLPARSFDLARPGCSAATGSIVATLRYVQPFYRPCLMSRRCDHASTLKCKHNIKRRKNWTQFYYSTYYLYWAKLQQLQWHAPTLLVLTAVLWGTTTCSKQNISSSLGVETLATRFTQTILQWNGKILVKSLV